MLCGTLGMSDISGGCRLRGKCLGDIWALVLVPSLWFMIFWEVRSHVTSWAHAQRCQPCFPCQGELMCPQMMSPNKSFLPYIFCPSDEKSKYRRGARILIAVFYVSTIAMISMCPHHHHQVTILQAWPLTHGTTGRSQNLVEMGLCGERRSWETCPWKG